MPEGGCSQSEKGKVGIKREATLAEAWLKMLSSMTAYVHGHEGKAQHVKEATY